MALAFKSVLTPKSGQNRFWDIQTLTRGKSLGNGKGAQMAGAEAGKLSVSGGV
jgi:hypothetical protein